MILPWSPPGPRSDRFSAGFTLVETMVVLVVLGLVAAAVAPDLRALLRPGSMAAAEELAGVYRNARAAATDRGQSVVVTLDHRTGAWRTYVGATGSPDEAVAHGNLLADRPDTRLRTAGDGPAIVRFGPAGRARGPAVSANRGGHSLQVVVDPWTGAVGVR